MARTIDAHWSFACEDTGGSLPTKNAHDVLPFCDLAQHCAISPLNSCTFLIEDLARPAVDRVNEALDLLDAAVGPNIDEDAPEPRRAEVLDERQDDDPMLSRRD